MLELMARGGMRVGEVLKLTPADVLGRKLVLNDTKSGKEQELIFIPQKVYSAWQNHTTHAELNHTISKPPGKVISLMFDCLNI